LNKKILGLAVTILTLAMLVAPAMAGKGQEKQDFELLFQGLPAGGYREAGNNRIYIDRTFWVGGDMHVKIGSDTIDGEYLEYAATMATVAHLDEFDETRFAHVQVRETISIYNSETHIPANLLGTLEILALGDNKAGNGASFIGYGTGDFEGVKIEGTSLPYSIIPDVTSPAGFWVQLIRQGTVMGWPT
jgi:hypothetical protein